MGGFRAVPDSLFKVQYTRPLMLGTRCHMMAMYAVMENYLQMVCDYPAAYEGQEGFEFIKQIPTTWDETRVIDAKPREFISIARRKGEDWYVGAITNHDERTINLALSFLDDHQYVAEIYSDADDASVNPNHLQKKSVQVSRQDKIPVKLAAGGGVAIWLRKQ